MRHTDPKIKKIEEYLNESHTEQDHVLWRGVKDDYAKILRSIIHKGAVIQEKGFMSTSTNQKFSNGWRNGDPHGVLMKISVPKGTPASAVTHLHHTGEHEAEIMIQRGRVLHIKSWDPKTRVAEVELRNEAPD